MFGASDGLVWFFQEQRTPQYPYISIFLEPMDYWPKPAQTEIHSSDIHPPQYADMSVNTEVLATTHLVTPILSVGAKGSHGAEPSILVSVQQYSNLSMCQV